MNDLLEKTVAALEKNRIAVTVVDRKADVPAAVAALLTPGCSVAVGGSVTLQETGVLDLLRSGQYRFLDRFAPDLSPEQREDVLRRSLTADAFLCSANAVTANGELYNVDGNANRVAALAYGPRRAIVVAGINKLVPDLAAAVRRVKTVAAPKNAVRLHCATPCAATGHCLCPDGGMTEGCDSPQRLCCEYLVTARQRDPDRIRVILVREACGY